MRFRVGRQTLRAIACLGLLLCAAPITASGGPEPKLTVIAPLDGAWVGAKFVVKGKLTDAPKGAVVHIGTDDVRVADDGSFAFTVTAESEGPRTIRVLYGPVGEPAIAEAREVTVDTTPPKLEDLLPAEESAEIGGDEATVSGHVVDVAPAEVRINGKKVRVLANGRFESIFVLPAEGEVVIKIEVSDAAGNVAPPVVRKLKRLVDRGPPALSFENEGVFWIARNGLRIALGGEAEKDAHAIGEHELKVAPLGTFDRPMLAEIRAPGVTPFAKFWIGWGALKLLKGNILALAPLPDPATASVKADVIDLLPAVAKDGSWRVRVGAKEWVISADDVRDSADFDLPIPASMTDTLDAVAVTLKASQKFAVVRLRFPEPVPLRLFELAWLAGYVHAKSDVIVERLDTSIAETPAAAPSAPATPAAPPPVDHVKLEKVLMSTNVPDAVSAAGELADKQCVESIPALRIALDRASNGLVRGAAAKALGRMNDLDSVPVLIALLGLPNGDLAADADTALSLMSGLGRVLKSDTPVNQRLAVASRYAAWWKGAEANLRKKKAAAPGK